MPLMIGLLTIRSPIFTKTRSLSNQTLTTINGLVGRSFCQIQLLVNHSCTKLLLLYSIEQLDFWKKSADCTG